MNFHRDLLSMNQEVHFWERMRMPIPYIALEINAQRDKYRVLRDNILMVRMGVYAWNFIHRGMRHAHGTMVGGPSTTAIPPARYGSSSRG